MIKIYTQENHLPEKLYIIDFFFKDVYGLDYKFYVSNTKDYKIVLPNTKEIIIKDDFFCKFNDGNDYLSIKNIPNSISVGYNQFSLEDDIIILYGNDDVQILNNKIVCSIDIFASSFFMLTRWEEYVNKLRDKHGRFPGFESLAAKKNFLNRPIVNEYIEMLFNMLFHLDKSLKRKTKTFSFFPTHDIDHLFYWKNNYLFKDIIKSLVGKHKNRSFEIINSYIKTCYNFKNDPFYKFDYFMDMAEKKNLKAYFFFMTGGNSIYDNNYNINDKKCLEVISYIKERNHCIGIHPSYNTYQNYNKMKKEYLVLSDLVGDSINYSRQHYLRFSVPETWQYLDDLDISWDSSMCYYDASGFRCGICIEFPVFNFKSRKKLNISERPLLFMESSYINYSYDSPLEMHKEINRMYDITKKYNGDFLFLWHNSSFYKLEYREYEYIYREIMVCNH